jgi:hypothetical protein
MNYLFINVFYKKSEGKCADDFMNSAYWLLLITKNILKWYYAVILMLGTTKNYGLFVILFISPMLKLLSISLGNIYKFSKLFKNKIVILIMSLFLLIESFVELPVHFLFPQNHIYLHSNYFKIYDIQKYRQVEILTELFENSMIIIFLYYSFTKLDDELSVIHILTLVFSIVMLFYFILAQFYFMLLHNDEIAKEVDEYGRSIKTREERMHKIKVYTDKKNQMDKKNTIEYFENLNKEKKVEMKELLTNSCLISERDAEHHSLAN